MSRLSRFLGAGTCLPDSPVCAPLRREAELAAEDFKSCERGGPCPRCVDLDSLKRQEVRTRAQTAVNNGDPSKLADLLREAASAHHAYEERIGAPDEDWPTWYAKYLLGLQEVI